jgi:hypothetical protein
MMVLGYMRSKQPFVSSSETGSSVAVVIGRNPCSTEMYSFFFYFSHENYHGYVRGCIQKFPYWAHNEIYAYNNKHSLRRNTKSYGGKTRYTDSQNSDTTASSGRELYHLQFSLQATSPKTFGYTLVFNILQTNTKVRNIFRPHDL